MRYTLNGPTGRAQLEVRGAEYQDGRLVRRGGRLEYVVKLLPRTANRNTAFSSAGEPAHRGGELERALLHIRAWTGLALDPLPASLAKLQQLESEVHEVALAS